MPLDAGHLRRETEFHALLLQDALELLGYLAVHAGRDPLQELDHRHLRTEALPDGAHLQTDIAAADHHQMVRHPIEIEGTGRADDALLVDLDTRQRHAFRTGGDDDGGGLEHLLAAGVETNLDPALPEDRAVALPVVHLVLLEEHLDAPGQAVDHLVLVAQHHLEIEADLTRPDTVIGHAVAGLVEQMRGVQQGLRRDAADIETGAAQAAALLDAGDLHAELRRLDGTDIAARPAADHHEIVAHHVSPCCAVARTPPVLPHAT